MEGAGACGMFEHWGSCLLHVWRDVALATFDLLQDPTRESLLVVELEACDDALAGLGFEVESFGCRV